MTDIYIPAALAQLTTGFGAGCVATLGAQRLYPWLSPTAQLQAIKQLLDETRDLIENLQQQNPGWVIEKSNGYTSLPLLKKSLAQYVIHIVQSLEYQQYSAM